MSDLQNHPPTPLSEMDPAALTETDPPGGTSFSEREARPAGDRWRERKFPLRHLDGGEPFR
jgi:hypothetical protein